jgi:CheY-like chemotaxis protein
MSESPAHLLVVDDDARLRALLQRYLAEQGFRITAAADAEAARRALASVAFDLVVMDVMMPGESGLELTESLRPEGQDVPILMLTARGSPDDRVAGSRAGWTTTSRSPSTRGSWRCASAPSCAAPRRPRRPSRMRGPCSSAAAGSTRSARSCADRRARRA